MADYDPHKEGQAHFGHRIARSDQEIRQEVYDRLIRDPRVDARQIEVEVAGGVVTLQGQVDSLAAKRAAGDDAWDAGGVLDISNLLRAPEPIGSGT